MADEQQITLENMTLAQAASIVIQLANKAPSIVGERYIVDRALQLVHNACLPAQETEGVPATVESDPANG
jgi:hypothetical protein